MANPNRTAHIAALLATGPGYRRFTFDVDGDFATQVTAFGEMVQPSPISLDVIGKELETARRLAQSGGSPASVARTFGDLAAAVTSSTIAAVTHRKFDSQIGELDRIVNAISDGAGILPPPVEGEFAWRRAQLGVQLPIEQALLLALRKMRTTNVKPSDRARLIQAVEHYYASFRDWSLAEGLPTGPSRISNPWSRRWAYFNHLIRQGPDISAVDATALPQLTPLSDAYRRGRFADALPYLKGSTAPEISSELLILRRFTNTRQTQDDVAERWDNDIKPAVLSALQLTDTHLRTLDPTDSEHGRLVAQPLIFAIEALWKADAAWPMELGEYQTDLGRQIDALANTRAALDTGSDVRGRAISFPVIDVIEQLAGIARVGPDSIGYGRRDAQDYVNGSENALRTDPNVDLVRRGVTLLAHQLSRFGEDTAQSIHRDHHERHRAVTLLALLEQGARNTRTLARRLGPPGLDVTARMGPEALATVTSLLNGLRHSDGSPVDPQLFADVAAFGERLSSVSIRTPEPTNIRSSHSTDPSDGYWLPVLSDAHRRTVILTPTSIVDVDPLAQINRERAALSKAGVAERQFSDATLAMLTRQPGPTEGAMRTNLQPWIRPALSFAVNATTKKSSATEDFLSGARTIVRAATALAPLFEGEATGYFDAGQRLLTQLQSVQREILRGGHTKKDAARTAGLLTQRKLVTEQLSRLLANLAGEIQAPVGAPATLDVQLGKVVAVAQTRTSYPNVDPAHRRKIEERFPLGWAKDAERRAIAESCVTASVGILTEMQDREQRGSPIDTDPPWLQPGDYAVYSDTRLDTELHSSVRRLLRWYARDLALRATTTTQELDDIATSLTDAEATIPRGVRDALRAGRGLTAKDMIHFRFQARDMWRELLPSTLQPYVLVARNSWDDAEPEKPQAGKDPPPGPAKTTKIRRGPRFR